MYQNILIAIDLEHETRAQVVIEEARLFANKQTRFLLLTVIPPMTGGRMVASFLPKNYDKLLREEMLRKLNDFAQTAFTADEQYQVEVAHGTIYEEINRVAKERNSELIVLAAAKPGATGLGPNAARVARYSERSVFIVR